MTAALVAAVCGVLSGMGVGGGTLLMVWFTVAASFPPATAAAYNLLYFLSCAPCAILSHLRSGNLNLSVIGLSLLGALPAAFTARWLADGLQGVWMDRIFALFLLVMGLREVLAKKP